MTRTRRMLLAVFMLVALPIIASSCIIPLGNGCSLLIAEPGIDAGVACNL